MPGRKVRIRSILDKADDLGVQLSLEEPPLIHVTGGRLVLDVQRPDRQTVQFSSVIEQIPVPGDAGRSKVPLGVDLGGNLQFVDLASPNNPHLLVAGTSGSGKSEWMRAAIAGILLANTPETLRLVLIDPKRNAFTELKGSPYLYGPKSLIYPPEDSAMDALEALIEEMEERYRRFSREAASDLIELHAKTGEVLPRIVCVCDEYADLIADRATKRELETAITRLGAQSSGRGNPSDHRHAVSGPQYGWWRAQDEPGRSRLPANDESRPVEHDHQSIRRREAARQGRPVFPKHRRTGAAAGSVPAGGGARAHL